MVAGTTFAVIPCSFCLPCLTIFQTRPWKTTDKEAKSVFTISQNSLFVKEKNPFKFPQRSLTFLKKLRTLSLKQPGGFGMNIDDQSIKKAAPGRLLIILQLF
jgi:hypothetical protein